MAFSWVLLSLLLSCLFSLGEAVICTEEHVGKSYSACTGNSRTAIYYWTSACDVEDYLLPNPIFNLPCDIQCDGGSYLPFGESQCQPCDKGKYSLGGGEIISDWHHFQEKMSTDCTGERCSAWNANITFAESGNNFNSINTESHLRLFARFIRPSGNMIRFSYTVDAESCTNCDGMTFYIDDQPKTSLLSHQLKWQTIEFNVTSGYHDLRWTYKKDYSLAKGLDRAFIRSIELIGTSYAPDSCADCPPGTAAPTLGSPACTPCGYNTHNSEFAQETCTACGANQTSFPGSVDCTNLKPCESKHIFSRRTACNPTTKTQNVEYSFISLGNGNVRVCDADHPNSAQLPSTKTNVPCFCPPGKRLDDNGACVYCDPGTARNSAQATCEPCPAGTAALEAMYFSDWSQMPTGVQTFCQGECDAQGWIPRGEHIDAGYGSGRKMESYLSIPNIVIDIRGTLEVKYTLASCGLACDLEIILDNTQAEEVEILALSSGTDKIFKTDLDPGHYTITWRYIQKDTIASDSTKVKIYTITISGVAEGGAPACSPCGPGSEAVEARSSSCTLCRPGEYSSQDGVNCVQADEGYFARSEGATHQVACGPNTVSLENRTDCYTDCTFTLPGMGIKTIKYDLNPLYNVESMNFAGSDSFSHQYFLNLCSREHKNASCYDEMGNAIPTFACQQVESWRYAVDLGSVIGFIPPQNPDNLTSFTVSMTDGTKGCSKTYAGVPQPRETNVTMFCDLAAGVGSPRPEYGNVVEYPPASCHYYFTWRSMYACPLCTPEDYKITISDCHEGKKVKTFVRLSECWDPAPIPPEELECKSCLLFNGTICNGHGSCDDLSGTCNCENGWASDSCENCRLGYYGPECGEECLGGATLPCFGHGQCSSGKEGNGTCFCSTGWTGGLCDTCADGFEGEKCDAIPATVADVVPWWGFVLIFGAVALIAVAVVVLWRQKRNVEYKYSSLLRSQPLEMDAEDNVVGIPQDDSDPENK